MILCLFLAGNLSAQDTMRAKELKELIVSSYKEERSSETPINILSLNKDSLNRWGNYNLTDLLSRVPGVTMMSTGVAIAKPVIRGLYGNRIAVLISGLKFDNQQWQEEHGLGLTDMGLYKVELVKGPMSVLYGTEAVGGLINLIEEEKLPDGHKETDFSIKMNSNTLGGFLQGGYRESKGNKWFKVRVGIENNADYSDGNNARVLNSRFDGYNLKATYGFTRKNMESTNNLLSSFNRYGFIFNDVYTFITPDKRGSRKLDVNPAHLVLLNIFSSENKFKLSKSSKLNFNFGIQSNERMENEGGGAISLNMHLLTLQYLLKWEQSLNERNKLVLSNLGSFEKNTNFGSRKIIPDANMQESNLSACLETVLGKYFVLENGLGVGEKWIQTKLTPSVNSADKDIKPFTRFAPYYNIYSGFTFFPDQGFNFKMNLATGMRMANLAELSSNGLHEGIFTYEIGDPNLKNEYNTAVNLLLQYKKKWLEISISPFLNLFSNFIYLAPTTENWFGFPIYRYRQQNAQQYGTEVFIATNLSARLNLNAAYSGIVSKTIDGNTIPYTPAQKISTCINYILSSKRNTKIHVFSRADYYLAQNNVASYEISTPEYWLLNAGVSATGTKGKQQYTVSLSGNNILNIAYYDHLSRFKNFGLLNMGRNICLSLAVKFQ